MISLRKNGGFTIEKSDSTLENGKTEGIQSGKKLGFHSGKQMFTLEKRRDFTM